MLRVGDVRIISADDGPSVYIVSITRARLTINEMLFTRRIEIQPGRSDGDISSLMRENTPVIQPNFTSSTH